MLVDLHQVSRVFMVVEEHVTSVIGCARVHVISKVLLDIRARFIFFEVGLDLSDHLVKLGAHGGFAGRHIVVISQKYTD